MRTIIGVLVTLTAASAFAAAGIAVHPDSTTLSVGDGMVLNAAWTPGGLSSGYPYSVTFYSDAPEVAKIWGFASGTGYLKPDPIPHNGEVYVLAIGPGIAHVRVNSCCGDVATISVRPYPVLAVTPGDVTVAQGKSVTLVASITNAPSYVTYEWFQGHTGDESRPLQISGSPILTFTPAPPMSAVWLRAMSANWQTSTEVISGTWQSTTEVKVSIMPIRRRAAR